MNTQTCSKISYHKRHYFWPIFPSYSSYIIPKKRCLALILITASPTLLSWSHSSHVFTMTPLKSILTRLPAFSILPEPGVNSQSSFSISSTLKHFLLFLIYISGCSLSISFAAPSFKNLNIGVYHKSILRRYLWLSAFFYLCAFLRQLNLNSNCKNTSCTSSHNLSLSSRYTYSAAYSTSQTGGIIDISNLKYPKQKLLNVYLLTCSSFCPHPVNCAFIYPAVQANAIISSFDVTLSHLLHL